MAEPQTRTQRRAFRLLSDEEVQRLTPPDPLVDGVLFEGAFSVLYGAPGTAKTFLALDLSLAIATGQEWQGRTTKRGRVVYLAGEGLLGLGRRIAAWKKEHGHDQRSHVVFGDREVNLLDAEDLDEIVFRISPLKPVLIVVDTLARAMPGADEDSARDMGLLVAAVDRLRRETGAAVLLVHHSTKKDAKTERGSSALRGAADTVLRLQMTKDGNLTLHCEKQKDMETGEPLGLSLVTVTLDGGATSCVVRSGRDASARPGATPTLAPRERTVLDQLAKRDQLRHQEWSRAVETAGIPKRTFDRHRGRLLELGLIEKVNAVGPQTYRVTEKGAATARALPNNCHDSADTAATTATPPIGGAVADGSLAHLGITPLHHGDDL